MGDIINSVIINVRLSQTPRKKCNFDGETQRIVDNSSTQNRGTQVLNNSG
jgi:hypothetical protein